MQLPKGAGWKLKSFWSNSYVFVWPGRADVTEAFPTIPCRCGLKQVLKFLEHQAQLMATCKCLGDYRKVFQQFLITHPNCLDKPKSDNRVVVFW
jgi:hypothetical protein